MVNIEFETHEIRPQLMDKITEFASKNTSEAYVQKMVSDINEEFRKNKNFLSNVPSNCENETMVLDDTQTNSETQNSQFLLFGTQDPNEKANLHTKENRTSDLKRRHERDENDDDLVLKKAKPDNEKDSQILKPIQNINAERAEAKSYFTKITNSFEQRISELDNKLKQVSDDFKQVSKEFHEANLNLIKI